MRVLVTGASGFIGLRFCEVAVQAGHDVLAFMRPGTRSLLPPGEIVFGQLPYDVPATAFHQLNAIVHFAGATTGQDMAESRAITVEGTRYLIEQARMLARPPRFVFISSQSAHEGAVSAYGRTKLEAEMVVRESGLPWTIVRPGLVFGPGDQGLFFRMRRSISRLPVIPLLGGGKALVQAIEVTDLAEALLRCMALPSDRNEEFNLGDPDGIALREFLQQVMIADRGRRKPQVVIPTAPLKLAVRIAGMLHIPFPISMDNIRGMETVQRMETRDSLRRLGMTLTPLPQAMAKAVAPRLKFPGPPNVPGVLLVGAGKIGIVHALNLRQRPSCRLAAIVDKQPKAFRMYESIGFRAPFRTSIADAVRESSAAAAIVATPAATHLAVARECLERGLHVLIEKPMAIRPDLLPEFQQLVASFPDRIIHVGYMAAQYPHVAKARDLLESGEIGEVLAFHASALQSHIMASKPVRWEMVKGQSGGGTLINFGSHVLSILLRLFGKPISTQTGMWRIHSVDVEDALEAQLTFPDGINGRFFTSWSMPGYSRPDNRLVVHGSVGTLELDNQSLSIRRNGKTLRFWTQLDFPVGYNASPDYTGAGFSREHQNFADAIAGRGPGDAVNVDEAVSLENMIFSMYQSARTAPIMASIGRPEDTAFDSLIRNLRP